MVGVISNIAIPYYTILWHTTQLYVNYMLTSTRNILSDFMGKYFFKNKQCEPYQLYANFYVNALTFTALMENQEKSRRA